MCESWFWKSVGYYRSVLASSEHYKKLKKSLDDAKIENLFADECEAESKSGRL